MLKTVLSELYGGFKGIEISKMDYYLIGGVFAFYFGLRSVEKAVGKS